MSYSAGPGYFRAEGKYVEALKKAGLVDAQSAFDHPKIEVWRSITERENCVLDHDGGRFHIKRNKPGHRGVDQEVHGIKLLESAGIKSVPIAGYGMLHDGRGFFISEDLAGFEDSEKLVEGGYSFEKLLEPTARLAARLHDAGLHHRDLYLCHFYARVEDDAVDLRLMDAGRVRKLPWLTKRRWIVKDVAQFVYSIRDLDQRLINQWLETYASARGVSMSIRRAIDRKVAFIARHDAKLRQKQPTRNVAIDR